MDKITQEELDGMIADHREWLASLGKRGSRIDLSGKELKSLSIIGKDISKAILTNCDLRYTNMKGTLLQECDFSGSGMNDIDLSYTDLRGSNLSYCNVKFANFNQAYLEGACLDNIEFSFAITDRHFIKTLHLYDLHINYTNKDMSINQHQYPIRHWFDNNSDIHEKIYGKYPMLKELLKTIIQETRE